MFAIKAEVRDPRRDVHVQRAEDDVWRQAHRQRRCDLCLRERERRRPGLIASGIVTSAKAIAKKRGIARQTPRVSITIRRTARASGAWGGASSNLFPTGTTAGPRPSSTSNSIVRPRTRSSASRMKRRRFSVDSFNAADFEMNMIWPNQAL